MADAKVEEPKEKSATYEAGCHCGYITFAVTLSPPLPEYKVLNCNCSVCRRMGYLLVYPEYKDVTWHGASRARCAAYRFNTKEKDQLFCPKCGASIGIDFRDYFLNHGKRLGLREVQEYGISVRTFNGIDLDTLQYAKSDGINGIPPAGDLSGKWYDEDEETAGAKDEKSLK